MNQNYKFSEISLGVCYYPEHWEKSLWQSDLERMKNAGIKTIRIAEFAWNKIEAKENHFDFSFFDEFLDLCEKENINVIFGTPTATPPAWLTQKYPEVLNCRIDGAKFNHGMRRHYNYNSKKYQFFSKRIVTKIMQHYGKRKCIAGYQIDNEINCETAEFYSKADDDAFRKFLKSKYKSLESLNENWGAVFWNQTYSNWNQVHIPRLTVQGSSNPHLMLDYYRFISQSAVNFCKMQSQIIRRYKTPQAFITTNGMFSNIDNHKMMNECLDVFTYDSYPNFAWCLDAGKNSDDLKDRMWSRNLSEARSVCRNFGIMEQQSGANGWNTKMEAISPKPGQIILWATQSIAHGADYISFFRWRTCTFGTEMYWHGILDYSGKDNRKLAEVKEFSKRIEKIKNLAQSDYFAEAALLRDYNNIFDSQTDVWHRRCASKSETEIFIACQKTHTPLDFVYIQNGKTSENLNRYKLIFYPHPEITDEKTVQSLCDYVKQGGILILGARAGQKMQNGKCRGQEMPGLFSSLTKTFVEDFTFVSDAEEKSTMIWNGKKLEAGIFNDILKCSETDFSPAKILAYYSSNYYVTKPALTESKIGLGKVLHFGGTFTRSNVKEFLDYTKTSSPLKDFVETNEDVELAMRKSADKKYIFILNFSSQNQEVHLKKNFCDLDEDKIIQGKIMLKPYETKILSVLE